MRIGINRIQMKNIGNGESLDLIAETSFSHSRMLIGNFTEAQALIRKAVVLAKGSGATGVPALSHTFNRTCNRRFNLN